MQPSRRASLHNLKEKTLFTDSNNYLGNAAHKRVLMMNYSSNCLNLAPSDFYLFRHFRFLRGKRFSLNKEVIETIEVFYEDRNIWRKVETIIRNSKEQ